MKLPRKPPLSARTKMLDVRKRSKSQILLDHVPVSHLVLDSSGVILDANLEAVHLLGKESRSLKGVPLSDFIYEGDREKFSHYVDQCHCNGEKAVVQLRLALPGTPLAELVTSVYPPSRTGKVLLQTIIHVHATNGSKQTGDNGRDKEVQKLSRTLRALSKSSQAMVRAVDQASYMNEVCKIVQEDCGHAMVWIGFAQDDEAKSILPVAYAGFEEGYLETLQLTWADSERGRGPTGTALRTGQPVLCRNMLTDPRFKPWRSEAIRRGYAASIALPLNSGGRPFGAIMIYSREADPFSDDEVRLLSQLADDLAYGLTAVRLMSAHEAAEQSLRESEERHRALFENMTEGFALHEIITDSHGSPCDYRFLEVNPSFEKLTGLKSADLLGKRVQEVLPDNERVWIERYGRVALTGDPVHFESYSAPLNRWYQVFAYRPAPLQFAVIFTDVTERKRIEEERHEVEQRVRRKLQSVLQPEGDLGVLELSDLIDVPAMQKLMDDFYAVARFPMSIVDVNGKVLVGVGWQDICTRFHRVHPESCKLCIESDTQLSAGVPLGEFRLYRCKNNLWDIATPIVVGGRQIGNIFSGQFFFEDEQIDRNIFRDQARRYGFDETHYLAALDRVPRLSKDIVERGMAFLLKLADMVSHLGYSNAKLARLLGERDRLTASLHEERERLKRSEEKYSTLFNTTSDGVLIHNLNGEVIEVNDAYCRMSGYSREQLLRMQVQGLEAVESPEEIAARIQNVLQKGGHDRFEARHRRQDGTLFDVDITALYLERDGGRMAIFVRDITERKRAEAALQESRNKYQALIETTSDFIWEMDSQGRYSYCSPQMEKLWGLKTADMIGKTPFDVMPPEQRQQGMNTFLKTMKTPQPFSGLESAALDGRGNLIFIETSGVPFFDADGVLLGYRGITRDITERKKAERQLQRSTERFALLSETASALLVSPDPQAVIEELCRKVMAHLDCDIFFNFLVDESAQCLRLNACSGVADEDLGKVQRVDFGVAICGRVARDKRRAIVEDIQRIPDERTDLVRSFGVQAYCCHPLLTSDKVIGTLSFGSRKRPQFTDQEIELMRVVADQVSVALERIRAEKALRDLNAQLEQRVQERTAALRKTTEALESERRRFMDVLDLLPAYVILLSPDYRVPFANQFFEERFGKSHGRRCFEYLFNRTEPCDTCETFKVLKHGEPLKWEWAGPDGRIYDISDFPFTDTDGSKLILEMGLDVTERKLAEAELQKHRHHLEELVHERTSQLTAANELLQSEIAERKEAEQALQASEERFRLAIQHSKLMAWQCDADMRFTWAYNSHFGVSSDQLLGKTPADLGYESGMQEFIEHGKEVLARGTGTRKIIKHVHTDSREGYFDQQIEAMRDPGGNIVGLIGISLDVTERVLAEQRLHRSEESFRLMVAHSIEPMLLVDESGKIECISRKGADQLGYQDSQLLGANIERFLDWSGKLDLTMRLEDFLRHAPVPARAVLRVKISSGSWCWIDLEASFINYGQSPQKYLLKFALINTDIPK